MLVSIASGQTSFFYIKIIKQSSKIDWKLSPPLLSRSQIWPEVKGQGAVWGGVGGSGVDCRSSLALLGCVRDALVQRSEAGEQRVPLVLLGLPEFGVGAVEPVQHAENPETLVEPGRRRKT